jgi:uncharacterized protein YodC (DUF2158 family)
MPDKLEIGDVVEVKSGGPKMTVDSLSDNGKFAGCAWFEALADGTYGALHASSFSLDTLKKTF